MNIVIATYIGLLDQQLETSQHYRLQIMQSPLGYKVSVAVLDTENRPMPHTQHSYANLFHMLNNWRIERLEDYAECAS